MTEIDTVVDGPSLRAWLEDLPRNSEEERAHVREVVILLMSRAAGRQLPAYWQALHAIDLDSTFQILRASLLPRVVSQRLSPPLRENVAAAARGVDAVSGSGAKSASDYAQVMTSVSGGSHAAIDPFEGSASQAAFDYATAAASYVMESPWVSTVWPEVRDDCQIAISPNFLVSAPLWQAGMPLAAERTWSDLRTLLGTPEHAERWAFWLHWYAGFLDPNAPETRPDWDMLEEIALIDPKVWDAGPDTVMPVINEIWEKYTPRQQSTLDLVDGALFTFRLDEVDRVLRAVPLPRDWEKLTDPNQLTAFLASAADVQDSLETLSEALRVGGDRPNLIATQLATYVDKAVNELRQAPELAELNAAKLLEWARVLESGTSESTLAELGVVAVPFEIAVEKLRDLIRRHFAGMLARMVDLRAIRTEEGVNPHRVLSEIREIVATARSGNGGRAYPLSPEDAAVLDDMLESVDHALLRQAGAETAEHKESAGRDADFTQSKVLATVESYRSKAASLLHRGDANADTVLKYKKKGEGLWALGQGVADLLNKLGGPPPT